MKKQQFYLFLAAIISVLIRIDAITKTREADILNLNGIQDGYTTNPSIGGVQGKGALEGKDVSVTGSQENRSFFKPSEADRRGPFYPSGPPGPSSGFGPNYHNSGNGYSYGAPSGAEYPVYGGSFPTRPTTSVGTHTGYGAGLGGTYGLTPSSHSGGSNHALALKGILLPIAGVALLGAAAVLAKSHPVLLQLGVVSGKRKRRSVNYDKFKDVYPKNPFIGQHKVVKRN